MCSCYGQRVFLRCEGELQVLTGIDADLGAKLCRFEEWSHLRTTTSAVSFVTSCEQRAARRFAETRRSLALSCRGGPLPRSAREMTSNKGRQSRTALGDVPARATSRPRTRTVGACHRTGCVRRTLALPGAGGRSRRPARSTAGSFRTGSRSARGWTKANAWPRHPRWGALVRAAPSRVAQLFHAFVVAGKRARVDPQRANVRHRRRWTRSSDSTPRAAA